MDAILLDLWKDAADEAHFHISQVAMIGATTAADVRSAHSVLSQILRRTSVVVLQSNYAEFRMTMSRGQAMAGADKHHLRAGLGDLGFAMTARVLNCLTSMRMFLDHSERDLKHRDAVDGGTRFATWKATASEEYDDYFGYRFISRFRNFVQHVDLPLSALQFSSALDPDGSGVTGRVFLGEHASHLLMSWDGWGPLKNELSALDGPIDITEQFEVAMDCLTRIAAAFVEVLRPEIVTALAPIDELLSGHTFRGSPWLAETEEDANGTNPLGAMMPIRTELVDRARTYI